MQTILVPNPHWKQVTQVRFLSSQGVFFKKLVSFLCWICINWPWGKCTHVHDQNSKYSLWKPNVLLTPTLSPLCSKCKQHLTKTWQQRGRPKLFWQIKAILFFLDIWTSGSTPKGILTLNPSHVWIHEDIKNLLWSVKKMLHHSLKTKVVLKTQSGFRACPVFWATFDTLENQNSLVYQETKEIWILKNHWMFCIIFSGESTLAFWRDPNLILQLINLVM